MPLSTADWFPCHSTLGAKECPCPILAPPVEIQFGGSMLLWYFAILEVMGRELLPVAPLSSALCWSPVREGAFVHLEWPRLTWPQDIVPATMSALQYRHGTPPRHGAIRWGPSSGGFIRSWVLSETYRYIPCPCLPTKWSYLVFARHSINYLL